MAGDQGSTGGDGVAARRLCVVSRNPLKPGVFIAGLTTSVGSGDELEIVVDRRRTSAPSAPPSIERRHRPSILRALERDGFAIVSAPSLRSSAILGAALTHAEAPTPTDRARADDTYEYRLERILRFKHRRMVQLSRWFIFSVVMNVILFLMLITPVIRSIVRQAAPVAPASSPDPPPSSVAGSASRPAATR